MYLNLQNASPARNGAQLNIYILRWNFPLVNNFPTPINLFEYKFYFEFHSGLQVCIAGYPVNRDFPRFSLNLQVCRRNWLCPNSRQPVATVPYLESLVSTYVPFTLPLPKLTSVKQTKLFKNIVKAGWDDDALGHVTGPVGVTWSFWTILWISPKVSNRKFIYCNDLLNYYLRFEASLSY